MDKRVNKLMTGGDKEVSDTYHKHHTVEQNRNGEHDGYEETVTIEILLSREGCPVVCR